MKDNLILNTEGKPSFLNKFGNQRIEVYDDIEKLNKRIQFLEAENETLKRENEYLKNKKRGEANNEKKT